MRKIIGWDIGGAHIKAALLDELGQLIQVQQMACPLWMGLGHLNTTLIAILTKMNIEPKSAVHALTMTGELVDLFANRGEGVLAIAQSVSQLFGNKLLFYRMDGDSGKPNFVPIAQVPENAKMIASANWHASASLIAQTLPTALLVDIGSTTTDIIIIENGKVLNRALTDAERMQEDTLIYTGVVRTPVMAIAQKLRLGSVETNVAAEYFATMADVYRITGELPEATDLVETADGGPKTIQASSRRLARMIGHDLEDKPHESWQQLAQACREKQCNLIKAAVSKHLTNNMTIVGAGAGHFLVKAIAQSFQQPYIALTTVLHQHEEVAICLPAYAVAVLAHQKGIV